MTVELRPLGVKCNIGCQYCYQTPIRDAGNVARTYDMERMRTAVEEEGGPFTLFGGEPLLVPLEDLEELWRWGWEKWQRNGIQTNGTLITDAHIELFRKYRVSVGISVDGPGELNDIRWAGTVEKTREATRKTNQAIERLCREKLTPSIIVTLHKNNATTDKLPIMADWFRHLDSVGLRNARLHVLEVDSNAVFQKYQLSHAETVQAFLYFAKLEDSLPKLRFDVFGDLRRMLLGEDNRATCIYNNCDPWTTSAVRGVEGNGQRSNCGRTNKEGIDLEKAAQTGYERYVALYHTPQEYGGCRGCRYFLMCRGNCPGTALDGDWRNRTDSCEMWKTLMTYIEGRCLDSGEATIPAQPELRERLEREMVKAWSAGQSVQMHSLLRQKRTGRRMNYMEAIRTSGHGDFTDRGTES